MSAVSKSALAAVIVGVTLCTLSVSSAVLQSAATTTQISELRAEAAEAKADLGAADVLLFGAEAMELAGATSHAARASVLSERPAFITAVAAAEAALTSAKDKVDVTAHRAAVIAARDTVLAERTDIEVVKAQTAAVTDIAGQVTAEVKAYDDRIAAEAAARAAARATGPRAGATTTGSGGGGGGWFADMRQRLTNVGGGHVELREFSGACGSVTVVACAFSQGYIAVAPGIASWSSSRKNWVAVHELAHIQHFSVWGAVAASGGYSQLFDSNPELLANCMASARGYTDHGHHSQCNADRIAWASQLWNGNVAW